MISLQPVKLLVSCYQCLSLRSIRLIMFSIAGSPRDVKNVLLCWNKMDSASLSILKRECQFLGFIFSFYIIFL